MDRGGRSVVEEVCGKVGWKVGNGGAGVEEEWVGMSE